MQALSEDLLDGAAAAAAFLGWKPRRVYRLVEANELPFIRMGGRLYFRKSELEKAFQSGSDNAVAAE